MMRPTSSAATPRVRATVRVAVAVLCLAIGLAATMPPLDPASAVAEQETGRGRLKEMDRLPLYKGSLLDSDVARSGWLLLNPVKRRGYQVFESFAGTTIQSFDLDTLQPRTRRAFSGYPMTSGVADATNPTATESAGEIVHAFDEAAGRLYIAFAHLSGTLGAGVSPDGQRQLLRVVAIDEQKFDEGKPDFAASFNPPPSQMRLHAHFLLSLQVARFTTSPGSSATLPKLFAVFASPNPPMYVAPTDTLLPGAHDHELVQWDLCEFSPTCPSGLRFQAGADSGGPGTPAGSVQPLGEAGSWAHHLTGCGTAPMATGGTGNYQWNVLVQPDAIHVGCQSAPGSGAVVRVALGRDPLDHHPTAPPAGDEEVFPLSQQISDVLVDHGKGRLLLRAWAVGVGHTWWVFDTAKKRYVGSIAAMQWHATPMGTGLDSTTGRLYSLTPDHHSLDGRGQIVPVRGGLQLSDTRLDPVPPLDNIRPDLAYNGTHAIRVDPVTRRVFVLRGNGAKPSMETYPSTQETTPAPTEPFYRVFEDRIPIADQPPEIDDSGFTTGTAEAEGLTTASYLATGAGYGSRVVLTGGFRALTAGNDGGSPCGKDDRELLVGSIGQVSVSNQSVTSEAAAMDADSRTREVFGNPMNRCKPSATRCDNPSVGGEPADTAELAFDQEYPDGRDENGDGCADRDGVNRYAAQCVADGTAKSPAVQRSVPRGGFVAEATCDSAAESAKAGSTGSMRAVDLLAPLGATPAAEVRVGYSNSKVTIDRNLGKGVEVKVDSIARGIEIPGVGSIGVVRVEASSKATGRLNGAGGTFERVICGVQLAALNETDCIRDPDEQQLVVDALNRALGSRGRARLRRPDDVLAQGSPSGYRAAVQREHDDLFADRVVDRDASLAVPGLELTFFQGDGGKIGAARQIFHFAGAQAATSYGVACLYGQVGGGRCATADEDYGSLPDFGPAAEPGEPIVTTIYESGGTTAFDGAGGRSGPAGRESIFERIVKAPFRLAEDALRLLFNNPREFGLMAAVWALLYAPCYLGERRRSIRGLRARAAAVGGIA